MNDTEIVVVGSINADLTTRVARHPRPGETLMGDGGSFSAGGKGANQAVAAGLLGADVAMVGAVGTDPQAEAALAPMRRAGVPPYRTCHRGRAGRPHRAPANSITT